MVGQTAGIPEGAARCTLRVPFNDIAELKGAMARHGSVKTFLLQIAMPPNPVRNLNNLYSNQEQAGRDLFFKTDAETTLSSPRILCATSFLYAVSSTW